MTDEKCLPCKLHTGIEADVENLKLAEMRWVQTTSRLWNAVEAKVSVKMFLSILGVAVTVISLVIGSLFVSQDRTLNHMLTSQGLMMDQMTDMKVDIGVIKSKISKLETNGQR